MTRGRLLVCLAFVLAANAARAADGSTSADLGGPVVVASPQNTVNGLNALSRAFVACRVSTICDEAYPDLQTRFETLFYRYEKAPLRFDGRSLDGVALVRMSILMVSGNPTVPLLPAFISALERGELRKAARIAGLDPRLDLARAALRSRCSDASYAAVSAASVGDEVDAAWSPALAERMISRGLTDASVVCGGAAPDLAAGAERAAPPSIDADAFAKERPGGAGRGRVGRRVGAAA